MSSGTLGSIIQFVHCITCYHVPDYKVAHVPEPKDWDAKVVPDIRNLVKSQFTKLFYCAHISQISQISQISHNPELL